MILNDYLMIVNDIFSIKLKVKLIDIIKTSTNFELS